MLLPRDVLSGTYKKPNAYLCETDKTKICKLETTNMSGSFKFNTFSELNFDVARVYNDIITGAIQVNPFYDKIEALRLILLEGFGYFELQDPEIDGDGIKEIKSLTANSLEYTLSQKYLETLYVNKGTVDSIEVLYAEEHNSSAIIPVTLYNPKIPELSLLHVILEKAYGWKIGHVDKSLHTLSRQFEVDRQSIYDFIMNEICEQFNCYVVFDTVNNTVNLYAEALTNKFKSDGATKTFTVTPAFAEIGSVSIDGYKTTNYTYNAITGELTLGSTPEFGRIIEVTDGSLSQWETDVYVTFDNLAQQMNISYSADDIKTVLTVKGADDLDIREVNNGLPYIVDLSYFHTVDWMGQDLYDAYSAYLDKCTQYQAEYKSNSQKILELSNRIAYETNRLSLQYSEASVSVDTVGTYYVRGGDVDSGYYYTEVSLPGDYVAGTTYYSTATTDLNETKVSALYEALKAYYHTGDMSGFTDSNSTLADDFSFMQSYEGSTRANLLRETGWYTEVAPRSVGWSVSSNFFRYPYNTYPGADDFYDNGFIYWTRIAGGDVWSPGIDVKAGETYTLSFRHRGAGLRAIWYGEDANGKQIWGHETGYGNPSTRDCTETRTIPANVVRLRIVFRTTNGESGVLGRIKLESGNKASMWSPHPEDSKSTALQRLVDILSSTSVSAPNKDAAVIIFFDKMWGQLGLAPLETLYLAPYKEIQTTNVSAGWAKKDNENYGLYYPVVLILKSLNSAISKRKTTISALETTLAIHSNRNSEIGTMLLISNNFSDKQMMRLNAFLREDEYTDDNFVATGNESTEELFKLKQELYECGHIELSKLCEPCLKFSMSLANIYALPEFAPIVNQFQLGNLIKVALRPDYVKHTRLMQVDLNFEDFSDFSCEFGDLSSIRSQTDLHADLLSQAVSAGKTVASSASYWDKGTDTVNSIDTRLQQGLLNAAAEIKAIDGTQNSFIDKYGIHLQEVDPVTGEVSDKQGWIVNNKFLYSDDNFTTTKSVFGEYTIDGKTYWGLLAEAVIAGYIEGSTIKGGTIQIGERIDGKYNFEVDANGNILMMGGRGVSANGNGNIFSKKPDKALKDGYCYKKGDMWVVGSDYQPTGYPQNATLVSTSNATSYSDDDWVESVEYSKTCTDLDNRTSKIEQHVVIDSAGLHLIGQDTTSTGTWFEAMLDSQELGFYAKHSGQAADKIVWLGTTDMNAKNVNVINYLNVQSENNSIKPYIKLGKFTFQIEYNGSLSIV